jgi:putative acetyltransferase
MALPAIAIRPFGHEDAAALAELFGASVRSLAGGDYTPAQIRAWASAIPDLERFAAQCAAKMTRVAVCDSRIAGFADLEPDGHVDMLYVHPDFGRRGVALALLVHLESVAGERGLRRLHTEASLTARPVFERRGFEVLARQTVTVGGEELTNYRMAKRLGPGR